MDDSLFNSALQMHRAGRFGEAAHFCTQALRATPRHYGALYMLAGLRAQAGALAEAEPLLRDAVSVRPDAAEAHFLRGNILVSLGRFRDAIAAFDAVLAVTPGLVEAMVNRAIALHGAGRIADALAALGEAAARAPERAAIHIARGTMQAELQNDAEALRDFERALAAEPGNAAAHAGRADALARQGRFAEALPSYDRAVKADPRNATLQQARVYALYRLRRHEEAAAACERLLAIDPDYPYMRGLMVHCRLQTAQWHGLDAERARIAAGIAQGKRVIWPFFNTGISCEPQDQRQCAAIWNADQAPAAPAPWRGQSHAHDKIRIAYLSADLHKHATAFLMAGVFERHDRTRFETVAVSFGPDDGSAMRARLKNGFDHFLDVRALPDGDVAEKLRAMEIDIAVDLKGNTLGARSGILARRPAPVQVSWLGFPATMGAPCLDYIIADPIVLPEQHRVHYSEKAAYLPDTYQCNDSARPRPGVAPSRAALGLPPDGFVFCCFNNTFKILPEMFDIWMRLLAGVEKSVLWLLKDNDAAVRRLQREAQLRGIDASRLVFAPRADQDEHIGRQQCADLFLDTLPYNAHTTASDALWIGRPIVTATGTGFAGRVATSLLHAIGVPELAASSLAEYEALALALPRDPARLAAMREKIAHHRDTHPLFDTARFTRHLEAAYEIMAARALRNEAPISFAVPALP